MASLRAAFYGHQVEQGLAGSTIRRRDTLLGQLERFAGGELVDVQADQVRGFLAGRSLSPASRRTVLSNIHAFYAWAIWAGHSERDPTARIPRPKVGPRLPRPIPEADLGLAVTMASDPRVRALLLLAGMSGLRCCELAALRWVDLEPEAARVIGKGGKHRVVPLHPAVTAALADVARGGPWVATEKSRPRTPVAVSQYLNRYLHRLGIAATMHQLRHRAATQAYAPKNNLLAVQRLLGHASVATTQIYALVADAEVRAAALAVPVPGIPRPDAARAASGQGASGALPPVSPKVPRATAGGL